MSDQAGSSRHRTSQRPVKSCGFCYRRKLKCDKVYPCSRCLSRGLGELCEQETVVVNGKVTGGSNNPISRRVPTLPQLKEENKTLHRKIAAQERVIRSLLDKVDGGPKLSSSDSRDDVPQSRESSAEIENEDEHEKRTEYLDRMGQVFGLSGREMIGGEQPLRLFAQPSTHTLVALQALVPLEQTHALVRYHCNFLHWIHTVFHVPSFLSDHDEWVSKITSGEAVTQSYGFYALYFATIACSLYFMDQDFASEMGFQEDSITILPRFWFDTSLNCLQLSGFMNFPTIPVLQTICILPTIAHAFDSSKYLASLMHCAVGLARDFNFHLIQNDYHTDSWGGNIKSQLVRRIWWCLMISDSLTPGAQHPFHLIYPAAWTSPPSNVNDIDLVDNQPIIALPPSRITCVSHLLIMGKLADIFRDFCHTFKDKASVNTRFRRVKAFDERLNRLFDDTPELRPRPLEVHSASYDPNLPYDWRPWSRYLWALAIPPIRIQLWRWFLGRSYTSSKFSEAREICITAARDTIAARLKPVPVMYQKNWHVSSYTVTAGMVLAIELTHGGGDEGTRRGLHSEIDQVLDLLKSTPNPNAMVKRGIEILAKMLTEAEDKGKQRTMSIMTAPLLWQVPASQQSPVEEANLAGSTDDVSFWQMPGMSGSGELDSDLFDMLLNSEAFQPSLSNDSSAGWY